MIKEYHDNIWSYKSEEHAPHISSEFSEWLSETWNKYGVNLVMAAEVYIEVFLDNQALWPPGTRKKTGYTMPGFEGEKETHGIVDDILLG